MRRMLLVGVGGIALLGAIAVAVVLATTEPGPGSSAPDAPSPAAPPPFADPGSAGSGPPSSDLPAGLVAGGAVTQVEKDAPPPKPPPGSWEAVAVVARAAALGPAGAALQRDLNDLQPDITRCFDEDAQARNGQRGGVTAVRDLAPMDDVGATVLMVEVEVSGNALRIVDAPVEARAGASDGLIICAQALLRGRTVAIPPSSASGRHRVLYTLLP
jgi:hypothetical protein